MRVFLTVLLTFFFMFFLQRLVLDVQTYVEQLSEVCAANVAVTR